MNYKWHIIGGSVFVAILIFLNIHFKVVSVFWHFYLLFVPVVIIYSILPDIDHQISVIRLIVTVALILVSIYFLIFKSKWYALIALLTLLVVWVLPKMRGWKHRGHFHSCILALLFSIPLFFYDWRLAIIGFIAYLSHLVMDLCMKIW